MISLPPSRLVREGARPCASTSLVATRLLVTAFGVLFAIGLLARSFAHAVIQITLENPGDLQSVSGIALVSGFAFASSGAKVMIKPRIDGTTHNLEIPCCGPRQDVVDAFGSGTPLNTSFGMLLNYGILDAGPHTVGVEISAPGETTRIIDHMVIVAQPGNTEFLTNFGLAGANVAIDGDELVIAGARVGTEETTTRTNVRVYYAPNSQSFIIGEAVNANPALFNNTQTIFNRSCLSSGCHGSENPQVGQTLTSGVSFQNIVAVRSTEVPTLLRVNPGNPADSYLLQKLEQTNPLVGGQMPLGGPPLSSDEIHTIREWILAGAPPPS